MSCTLLVPHRRRVARYTVHPPLETDQQIEQAWGVVVGERRRDTGDEHRDTDQPSPDLEHRVTWFPSSVVEGVRVVSVWLGPEPMMAMRTLPLLSLQLGGRPVAMSSGNLWVRTDDEDRVLRWGIDAILERAMTLPESGRIEIRAKSGPWIARGDVEVVKNVALAAGYSELALRGWGRLSGIGFG